MEFFVQNRTFKLCIGKVLSFVPLDSQQRGHLDSYISRGIASVHTEHWFCISREHLFEQWVSEDYIQYIWKAFYPKRNPFQDSFCISLFFCSMQFYLSHKLNRFHNNVCHAAWPMHEVGKIVKFDSFSRKILTKFFLIDWRSLSLKVISN